MKMKRIIILTVTAAFLFSGLTFADPFKVPNLPSKEVRKAQVSLDPPDALSKATFFSQKVLLLEAPKDFTNTIEKSTDGGKKVYLYTSESTLNNGAKSTTKVTFTGEGDLSIIKADIEIKTPAGKVVRKDTYDFSDPIFRYPKGMMHPAMLEI